MSELKSTAHNGMYSYSAGYEVIETETTVTEKSYDSKGNLVKEVITKTVSKKTPSGQWYPQIYSTK